MSLMIDIMRKPLVHLSLILLLFFSSVHLSSFTNVEVAQANTFNSPPTDIMLSNQTLAENLSANALVGDLSAEDPNTRDTFSFQLVAGAGGDDNSQFSIVGASLFANSSFDFEAKSTYQIRIRVSDGTNTYEEALLISVSDVNEAPTDLLLSPQTINENSGADALVGTLSTIDQDETNTFTYTFVNGAGSDDNSRFSLDGNRLLSNFSLNYEVESSYNVRLEVSDGQFRLERPFIITVSDINETPTGLTLGNDKLAENAGVDAEVGQLSATDPDVASHFQYSLAVGLGDTNNSLFRISGNRLLARGSFDFEKQATHSVRVQVSDGALTFEEVFVIEVTDVAEAPTGLLLSGSSVNENMPSGSAVGLLSATDPDAVNTFTYSLVTGSGDDDNLLFSIQGNQLQTEASFDFESKSQYSIRVQVSDGSFSFEQPFTLTITDVNEAPFDIFLSSSAVNENQGTNVPVGQLNADDPDQGQTFLFSLVSGAGDSDNEMFAIDQNQLLVNESLNFEAKAEYSVRIAVTDGQFSYEEAVQISVIDVNETPTNLILNPQQIAENSGANAEIGVLSAEDPDSGSSFTYALAVGSGDDDNPSFTITNGRLLAKQSFDYENKQEYQVRIQVSDGQLTFAQTFLISVTDVREAPNTLTLNPANLSENKPASEQVGTFTAGDPDSQNTFSYSLVAGSGDQDNLLFEVVGDQLLAKQPLDFEQQAQYSIRASVSDGFFQFEQTFLVTLTDVNEAPTTLRLSNTQIAENNNSGTLVGLFSADDPDAGSNLQFSFVSGIGDADNSAFAMNGDRLETVQTFDFEAKSSYSIRVAVTDENGLTLEKSFVIQVVDAADPPTAIALNNLTISENSPPNTRVGVFSTTDPDQGSVFAYQLVSGVGDIDNAAFIISDQQLLARYPFDFESKQQLSVRVRVSDGTFVLDRVFTIAVTNANDAPNGLRLSATSIPENAGGNVLVGTISATDPDVGSSFTYRLVSGVGSADNQSFLISGNRFLAKLSFNFEVKNTYRVRLQVSDGESVFEQPFVLTVTDVNEAPSNVLLSNATVSENSGIGVQIGSLSVVDVDRTNQTFAYSLVSGPGDVNNSHFEVKNRALHAKVSFDFETKRKYMVRLSVSDGALSFAKPIEINVIDVNEAPSQPVLSNVSLPELKPAGTVVGNLSARDRDAGALLTFALLTSNAGTDHTHFYIEGTQLKTKTTFDFETKTSYSLRISVTDGTFRVMTPVTIKITNVNEVPTQLQLSSSSVEEFSPINTRIGLLSAVDPDAGTIFRYSFVSGAGAKDNNWFSLNRNELLVKQMPDTLKATNLSVRIRVTDQAGGSLDSVFTVKVRPKQYQFIGYLKGFADGTFRPDGHLTRGQVAEMVLRLMEQAERKLSVVQSTVSYSDVTPDSPLHPVISALSRYNVMIGYPDGTFLPNQFITHREMRIIADNYIKMTTSQYGVGAGNVFCRFCRTNYHRTEIQKYMDGQRMSGAPRVFAGNRVSRAEAVMILNRLFHLGPIANATVSSWRDIATGHWAMREIEAATLTRTSIRTFNDQEMLVSRSGSQAIK